MKPSGSLRFRQISSARLGDADLIRVGQTVLELRIDVEGDLALVKPPDTGSRKDKPKTLTAHVTVEK